MRKWIFSLFASLFCVMYVTVGYAQVLDELAVGTYPVNASLACYVNAMGGVEFGGPMLTAAEVTVGADGTKSMTMHLQKSVVTIYSVTCDTFVDAAPAGAVTDGNVAAGTIGYYNGSGSLVTSGVTHTLSSDTALNPKQEAVSYVNSITFPIEEEKESYGLTLYVNSNVMGTQFSNDGHKATLTVDWSSVAAAADAGETETSETSAAETEAEPETAGQTEEMEAAKMETIPETLTAETETASEMETAAETEETSEKSVANVETMSGLNIYRADTEEEMEAVEKTSSAGSYTTHLNPTFFAVLITVAVMLVLMGVVLMIAAAMEHKKQKKQGEEKHEK